MAKTALVYLNIQITGDEINPQNIVPEFVSNTASPAEALIVGLTNGATTFTPPSTARFALLVPISTATIAKTLKGVTGDTGYALSTNQPTLLALTTTPSTFVITCTSTENINVYYF
jgi:hypothetical protein